MSFNLNRAGSDTVLRKGGSEAFRPGVDQLPGSCMEFYMSDDGVASVNAQNSVLIAARDVPLVYMGSMNHHPIKLCDKNAENNASTIIRFGSQTSRCPMLQWMSFMSSYLIHMF